MSIKQKLSRTKAEIPFKPSARLSAIAVVNPYDAEKLTVYVKGAPETIFEMCDRQLENDSIGAFDVENATKFVDTAASSSLRLIAFAFIELDLADWEAKFETGDGSPEKLLEEALNGDDFKLCFVGVFGLHDSIRNKVPSCVKHVKESAKIMVRLVSGDHKETVR